MLFFPYKNHLSKTVYSQTAYQKSFIFIWEVMKSQQELNINSIASNVS